MHEQNGDIQVTTKLNEITQNIDHRPIINQKPNGHLHHAIGINGGPKLELEADKAMTPLTHEENEPYLAAVPSTSSVADANPLVCAQPEIDAQPAADTYPINLTANASPVAESNRPGGSTPVAGNNPSSVDSSTMTGLKTTADDVSKAYIAEDGVTDKVTETLTTSKVH